MARLDAPGWAGENKGHFDQPGLKTPGSDDGPFQKAFPVSTFHSLIFLCFCPILTLSKNKSFSTWFQNQEAKMKENDFLAN